MHEPLGLKAELPRMNAGAPHHPIWRNLAESYLGHGSGLAPHGRSAVKTKLLLNFVMRAARARLAFVKSNGLCDKMRKCRVAMDPVFQVPQPARSFLLAARQRNVRMIGASLRHKPAKTGCRGNALLKCCQLGREAHTSKENAGALKESQSLKLYRYHRRAQLAKLRHDAFVFRSIAQKLQSDMPRHRSGPTQAVVA
jgi:hypothetical protein